MDPIKLSNMTSRHHDSLRPLTIPYNLAQRAACPIGIKSGRRGTVSTMRRRSPSRAALLVQTCLLLHSPHAHPKNTPFPSSIGRRILHYILTLNIESPEGQERSSSQNPTVRVNCEILEGARLTNCRHNLISQRQGSRPKTWEVAYGLRVVAGVEQLNHREAKADLSKYPLRVLR